METLKERLAEVLVAEALFIVFEGGEGSGKSTQAERLQERLLNDGRPAVLMREPGTTALGLYLREYLKSKRPITLEAELLLFAAARAQLVSEEIRPALLNGVSVIADRYTGSTVAYQGFGRGAKREVVDYVNEYVTGGLNPDATFFLDITPQEGLHRVGSLQLRMALSPEESTGVGRADGAEQRRFEDESLAFHNRVRRGYQELARTCPNWHILDANLHQDELAGGIWSIVEEMLPPVVAPFGVPAPGDVLHSKR